MLEAEQAVIGALLGNSSAIEHVGELGATDFRDDLLATIFQSILAATADEQFDLVSVKAEMLARECAMAESEIIQYLQALIEVCPASGNIAYYVSLVKEASHKRSLKAGLSDLQYRFDDYDSEEVVAVMDELSRSIDGTTSKGMAPLSDNIDDLMEELKKRASGQSRGLSTGFKDLDKITNGLHEGDMIVVAGRPGMGKTTIAMNLAEHAACDGNVVYLYSLEMSSLSLLERMTSSLSGVPFDKVRTGQDLNETDWRSIKSASGLIERLEIEIDDRAQVTMDQMLVRTRACARIKAPDLIIIDYLQLIETGSTENRTNEVSAISRKVKLMAREHNCPVVVLSQLNRSVENRPDKRPQLSDLRDSGAIEQDADLVLFCYRDEVYNPEAVMKGIAEIIIGKQRQGTTGTVHLDFQGENCRFKTRTMPLPDIHSVGYTNQLMPGRNQPVF